MYTVTVTMVDGSTQRRLAALTSVPGLVLVFWDDHVTVTHEPSLHRLATVRTRERADEAVDVLGALGIDWTLPADELRNRYSAHRALSQYLNVVDEDRQRQLPT